MNPRILAIMAAMAHVEGYFASHTLAFSNCNPGNLTKWGNNPINGRFVKFPNPEKGFDALYQDIAVNGNSRLRDFIAKYAPPNENNTSNYLEAVCQFSGIGPDEIING